MLTVIEGITGGVTVFEGVADGVTAPDVDSVGVRLAVIEGDTDEVTVREVDGVGMQFERTRIFMLICSATNTVPEASTVTP